MNAPTIAPAIAPPVVVLAPDAEEPLAADEVEPLTGAVPSPQKDSLDTMHPGTEYDTDADVVDEPDNVKAATK